MAQRPLIKNAIVVNVIAIDDDTLCVTKADHKTMQAAEDADYAAKMAEWRKGLAERRAAISAEQHKAFIATGIANALTVQRGAEGEMPKARRHPAGYYDAQIGAAQNDAKAALERIAEIEAQPVPPKPRVVRAKRWIFPGGHQVGVKGGNIGDRWDGKSYISPEGKTAA